MRIKLAAGFAFVAALAGCWFYFQSRAITVWLYTDYAFRFKHANWSELVAGRFKEVNRIYRYNSTGIRWKVLDASQTDPTSTIPGIDNRRTNMVFHTDDKADVFVILTGIQEGDRTGSVNPFTRTAVVVDYPEKSEIFNGRLLAHELTHLFGAPPDPTWLHTLMSEKKESEEFTPRTHALIKRMRNYPFNLGIDGLAHGAWEKKALAALAELDTGARANAMAHAHTVIGMALLNERKTDAALVHLREAVKADPANVTMRLNLAEAYTRDGQDERALEQVRELSKLAPGNPLTHRALGALLGRTHRPEEALKELRIAVSMEPNNAETQVLLGIQLATMLGRLDEAIAVLQEAIRQDPNSPVAKDGIAKAQEVKQRIADELVTQRGLLQRNPNDADAHYRLGKVEARMGDFAAAIRDFQRASELRPENGSPHAELAEVYLAKGDFGESWDQVRKARSLGTEIPNSLLARLPAQK